MTTIVKGNERVLAAAGKSTVKTEAQYRISDFVLFYRGYLKNYLTDEVVKLTDSERSFITQLVEKDQPQDSQRCVSGQAVMDAGLDELVKRAFLLEAATDERKMYLSVLNVVKLMEGRKPGIYSYTILPTTACNARCVYCYEQGIQNVTMDEKMAEKVVAFIKRTKCDGPIQFRWFGGEPLIGADTITWICGKMQEAAIEYSSSMITNASLFTKELAHTAKTVWRLKRVQVSLDGDRADYEARKRYIDSGRFNYDTVMQAIRYLLDEGIRVVLRCNYDEANLPGIGNFLKDVQRAFQNEENLTVYFGMLYQERAKAESIALQEKQLPLREEAKRLGLSLKSRKVQFRTHHCMADSEGRAVVINADGKLYRCEHLVGACGDIQQDWKGFGEPCEIADECARCIFLPICTPFIKKCPASNKYCWNRMMTEETYYLDCLAREADGTEHPGGDHE